MLICRLLLLLLFSLPVLSQGNTLKFDHLSVEDGLSQGAVYTILQDSRGFMWFGTRFGLNRYDGHEFRLFSHDPQDSSSLPAYRVFALFEDHESTLWVATETGGLARYNRNTESFTNFRNDPADPSSLSSNHTTCIFEDSAQTLWIGTNNGLNRFDRKLQRFVKYYHLEGDSSSLSTSHISSLAEIAEGVLIIGLGNGSLATLDIETEQITNIQSDHFWPAKTSSREIECIKKDINGDYVWLSKFGFGLTKYSLSEGILEHYEITEIDDNGISVNFIYSISQDRTGKLWLATIGGLTVFDPLTEQFNFNQYDDANPEGLSDKIINSTFIDAQGMIWAGLESRGINIYKPNQIRFEKFSHIPGDPKTPNANNIYSLTEDSQGDIWFTTLSGGTNRYHPEKGTYRYYMTDNRDPNSWSLNYAMQVMIDQFGIAWIGTVVAGLSEVDPESGDRLRLHYNNSSNPKSLSGHTITSLMESRDGTIWVGTKENGLNRYLGARNFTSYQHDPDDPKSISGNCIYAIVEDHEGVLWIGTAEGGLNRYHPETETFTSFMYSAENENCIKSNNVLTIHEDKHGNLWIGTRGGGLNKLDSARKNFSTLDLGFENRNSIVYKILEDDHGYLWLSTNNGLIKVDPEKGFLNRYTLIDGLQGNEFYYNSGLKDSRGTLYFGGPNGFNRFHPDSIVNNPHVPPVVITELKINYENVPIGKMDDGRTLLSKSITETDKLVLSHGDRTISLTYAALDFADPTRNRFAYMLENFDPTWVNAGLKQTVNYTSLEPGEYVFRVKASNNDGLWNEEGVALAITILPPFWQTWWFRLLLSLTLILLVFGYIHLRLKRIEAEKRKLEKLVIERTAELKMEIEERQRVETEKMQLKVDHLKRELVSKSVCATQKQEIMNNLFQELKDIQKMDANEMRDRFNRIIRYFKNLFKSDEDWDEFEKWFTEVHTDFFTNIRQEYPELSPREVKVCALLRLNLLSKDIANLMSVQLNTVEIYRHRIRKKIGIPAEENLSHFFAQF